MLPPVVVNITRLHRETAAVIRQAERSDSPVFVTQRACVAAVLLPRPMYDRLLRAAQKGAADNVAGGRGAAVDGAAQRAAQELAMAETASVARGEAEAEREPEAAQGSWTLTASPLEGPLAVFGPLPPGTRFQPKRGLPVDARLAALLMDLGQQVTPILLRRGDEDDGEW